jgi:hypothetical protein
MNKKITREYPKKQRITKVLFKKAIKNSFGVISVAAKMLRVTRGAVYQWLERHPDMKDILKKERLEIIDIAENRLYKHVVDGNPWAIKTILNTIGKDRGLSENNIQFLEVNDNPLKARLEQMNLMMEDSDDTSNDDE